MRGKCLEWSLTVFKMLLAWINQGMRRERNQLALELSRLPSRVDLNDDGQINPKEVLKERN
jgi:hypothetical protein